MRAILLFSFLIFLLSFNGQTLVRKAAIGASVTPDPQGMKIDSIYYNGTAQNLKLQKEDILVSINGHPVSTLETYKEHTSVLRSGDPLVIKFLRKGKNMSATGKALMRPLERSEFADITYDWVKFRNGFLRAIIRKPVNKTNTPCILLIPGYGCGSIENYAQSYNGNLMNEWLKNGYSVVTIEKSGMGDSYGCAPCTEVDLATDIESFDAGYKYMENLPFVDKSSLFIWGHSMGGIIAPEIAKLHTPKGVMVFGTVFRPWSEFLLEMHRVQKPLLEGLNYEDTEKFVRLIQKVYYEFFVLKKTRAELYENKEYTAIVKQELEHSENSNNMWGRHWRFWQQLDSLNLAESWRKTACPVLVINGGADYEQCAPIEPLLIEKTVNSAHGGNATRVQIENLDHFMMNSNSFKEAVANFKSHQYTKGNFNYKLSDETIQWLNKQCGKS